MRSFVKLLSITVLVALGVAGCTDDPTGPSLGTPANVEARNISLTTVRVSWGAAAGASSYEVEGAAGGAATFTQMGTTTETSLEIGGLTAGEEYRFRVVAVSGSTRSEPSGPSLAIVAGELDEVVITADITSDRTFHQDTTYVLSGFIKVQNGATLRIEPGTKIVGDYDVPGSSLFILRGGRILAEGTADEPIVFTSERPVGQRQPGDWGGLIIIGNGIVNRTGQTAIEGTGTPPAANPYQYYDGGTDNDDDSGILRYVRIEFAGYPTAPNEELNALTMAAVGGGTTVEYVQVLQGLDDSFEWFGGAVNTRHLVSYESGDDHFDASEGHVGRHQFLVAFQSIRPEIRPGLQGGVASDPQGIENDGCWAENCSAGGSDDLRGQSQPYTIPVFANFTLVGAPHGAWETTGGNYGMMLRRGVGGLYVNSVVARYSRAAISLRGQTAKDRFDAGDLRIRNLYVTETCNDAGDSCTAMNAFQNENLTASSESRTYALDHEEYDIEMGSAATTGLFTALPTETGTATGASFDWRPAAGSPIGTGGLEDFAGLPQQLAAATEANAHPNSEIVPTAYRGAADPDGPAWWEGWTSYARN